MQAEGGDVLDRAMQALEEQEKRNIFDPNDPKDNGTQARPIGKNQQKSMRF